VETEEVEFSGAGVRLNATITVPGPASASPGIVLIGGSGPSDRHSDGFEGGWVALRLCARLATLRHLIINSCPAVSFAESEAYALTRAGAEPDKAAALIAQLTAAVQAGLEYEEGQRILATCEHEPWYPALAADGFSRCG
jgi:hypothetical protein